jgi:hypothetical protein
MSGYNRTSIGFFAAICASLAALALSGCGAITKDLGNAGKAPGIYVCAGKGTISVVGQVGMFGGANGSITYDCGTGAYVGQGYPAANLPLVKSAVPMGIEGFPPLGTPPAAAQ